MKFNEVMRKYRKEQKLTQEQIANYLGVTAPAVNKWEKGISYPDITLLAPLARMLKTDIDTLLSFHEELTDIEINQFMREISAEISTKGYQETFEKASRVIREYPNCDKLILYSAQILNGYLIMKIHDIQNKENYEKQIIAWFEQIAFSENKELANMAIMSLSQNYITDGNYEEAQKLLNQIPPVGFDKRVTQANLYTHQGLFDKAYEIHEGMLYQSANTVIASLMQIISLLCNQKQYDTALKYADLAEIVAEKFDFGMYIAASSKFTIFAEMKKEEECLDTLEQMINGINTMGYTKKSNLYQHMKFNEDDGLGTMKDMIKKSFLQDEELEFLRKNVRFKSIISKLN